MMMHNMLKGKKILVTGASSGIGRETAIFCSQQGAQVILTGRDRHRLSETLACMLGKEHIIVQSNVADESSIKAMMDFIYTEVGVLDAMIHCAGIQITVPLKAVKEQQYKDTFDTNVKSAMFLAQNFRKKGRQNPDGSSIVFLSSVAANNGNSSNAIYSASKGAIEGLTKSFAIELARQSIRVNSIAPSLVETHMTNELHSLFTEEQIKRLKDKHPLGFGKPENVAHAAAFLSSDYSQWITGTCMFVDGGYNAY